MAYFVLLSPTAIARVHVITAHNRTQVKRDDRNASRVCLLHAVLTQNTPSITVIN